MNKHTDERDIWWHERATKPADLSTQRQALADRPLRKSRSVWKEAALAVAVMFALMLSLISMLGR